MQAWRIPRVVREHLRKTALPGAEQVWFVMTCGGEIGNADRYNRALCREKGLTGMGTVQLVMPENYIALFNAPQPEQARQIVAKAEPELDRAIDAIRSGRPFDPPRNNLYDRLMSGPVNPAFYSCFVSDRAFRVGEACTGCGSCARRCPVNNILLYDGKPVWCGSCTHCMAWVGVTTTRRAPTLTGVVSPALMRSFRLSSGSSSASAMRCAAYLLFPVPEK